MLHRFCLFRYAIPLLVLLTLPLRANLGDSVAQCVARYGKPANFTEAGPNHPFGTLVFAATDYALIVFVIHNNEVGARVSRIDKKALGDSEVKNIMAADSVPASPWTPTTSDDPTCLEWTRADHATVIYDKVKHMLIFTSPEMATALKSSP